MISLVGHAEPTEVADVLTECQPTVHLQTRQRVKIVILGCETVNSLAEGLVVLRLPPGTQYAARIGLRSLIIKTMAHLVTDHPADATVIDRRVRIGIKEWRLEYGCGKDD